ncbi:sensor histidine kinase [Kurthia sp. Dielmo]|uniref:sensor histidine kinase n=1 Tax=Kurthia sp. Dielmo TaxID=1033738 RepID=UPI001122E824|nr:ATP-binding protein [Kurthia sp. Dielmo]
MLRKKVFLFIVINLILHLYSLGIVLKNPIIGIQVSKQLNQQWVISDVQKDSWGEQVGLEKGMEIIKINESSVSVDNKDIFYITSAQSLTVLVDGEYNNFDVSYNNLSSQFIMHIIAPLIYLIVTEILCIYLVQRQLSKGNLFLILHLQFTALAYISAGAAGRSDFIANTLNSLAIFFSLVSCIYYCKYLLKSYTHKVVRLGNFLTVFLAVLLIALNITRISYEHFLSFQIIIELLLYAFLALYLIINILISIKKNQKFYAKPLFIVFLLSIGPFILLYATPTILKIPPLLPADLAAVFLLIAPICLVILELGRKLYNLPFAINRMFYHINFILVYSVLFSLILILFSQQKTFYLYSVYLFITFISTILLSVSKEWVDFKKNSLMTTLKDYNFNHFYKFIQSTKQVEGSERLLEQIKKELYILLKVNHIDFIENMDLNNDVYKNKAQFKIICPGFIYKHNSNYVFVLHETVDSNLVAIVDNSFEKVQLESIKMLEMFLYFVQNLIDQSIKVDELIARIARIDNLQSASWYHKLWLSSTEHERLRLSTEIHDTVLQDLIYINRKFEEILVSKDGKYNVAHMEMLFDDMLDLIDSTREICEKLYPPLIERVGLFYSVQELIYKYKLRHNFLIKDKIVEITDLSLQQSTIIYRIVQELLTNSVKHSQANNIYIELYEENQKIFIVYKDDGVGLKQCIPKERQTIGLIGIQERIKYYQGTFEVAENEPTGVMIFITMKKGEINENISFR